MKYVFLAYSDETILRSMPQSDLDMLGEARVANDEAMQASGYLLTVERLQSSETATTLRVENGELVLSDGPCIKTHEQLISLFFIQACDLNQALQIAAHMPQVRSGPIEVRPVME